MEDDRIDRKMQLQMKEAAGLLGTARRRLNPGSDADGRHLQSVFRIRMLFVIDG